MSCAFVRWYTSVGALPRPSGSKALRLERLRWEMVTVGNRRMPRYDVIPVDSIIGPAYIQPEPDTDGQIFYHNKFVF